MKPKIWAVEDDTSIQELYLYALENEFHCRCFEEGSSLMEALSESQPDLILLDIMLPGEDGFSLLTRLKKKQSTSHIPVIMVSAKGEEVSKVKGLTLGADDYLAKPFGVLELIARIKANLRKTTKVTVDHQDYKDINIDYAKHRVTINGVAVKTTLKEYDLLCLLVDNADTVVERETIFLDVWGSSFMGETRTLDYHIKELRKKLSDAGSEAEIQTVRGVGFMLT
ncbi:MAG: response regulator transcription factor [Propionibacteriaceae bacterium]|jgi:two-component system alkaline phosphatase synthesis response regulator PhoP|nr:response regulator transcription factor [Propionibacteriaceae bacterium]